jgi:hypothetical protein
MASQPDPAYLNQRFAEWNCLMKPYLRPVGMPAHAK